MRRRPELAARWLGRACVAMALLLPIATLASVGLPWPAALVATVSKSLPGDPTNVVRGPGLLAAAAFLLLVPVLLMSAALLRAHRCFAALARGEHFTHGVVHELRRFAALVLAAAVAGLLVPTLVSLLWTAGGPGPGRMVVSVGSSSVLLLLFSAVTWQIAAVLAEAVELAGEHAQIV